MKTGWMLSRLVAGLPTAAGICLMQGCTTMDTKAPPTETPVAPVAITNKVEAPVKVEQPVEQPVEKPKLKTVPSTSTAYKAKAGETVADVAAKYGKRTKEVMALNPDILNANHHLKTGQTVYLPNPVDLSKPRALPKKTVKKAATATAAKPAAETATASAGEETYVVKSGGLCMGAPFMSRPRIEARSKRKPSI